MQKLKKTKLKPGLAAAYAIWSQNGADLSYNSRGPQGPTIIQYNHCDRYIFSNYGCAFYCNRFNPR